MPRHSDFARFHALLSAKPRILLVCGAGLSASSGLPTFRGAGGLWREYSAVDLATPEAFEQDPGLVWLFYAYRRHMSMKANPNRGHHALAALAQKYDNVFCVSQNVDGLLEKADYPLEKLRKIHGCLYGLKCFNEDCDWRASNSTDDPLWPILAPASADVDSTNPIPLLDPAHPAPKISWDEIPKCPKCGAEEEYGLQRPDIVWFGEPMDDHVVRDVEEWIDGGVDIVLSIGTSEVVNTAASFLYHARSNGAIYVNVNLDAALPHHLGNLDQDDFAFAGDAMELLPKLFEPIIGDV